MRQHAGVDSGTAERPQAERNGNSRLAALYLAALDTPGLGFTQLRRLVVARGGIEGVADSPTRELARVEGVRAEVAAKLHRTLKRALQRRERDVEAARAAGLDVLTWEDAYYPAALLDDPSGGAPVLFVEGRLPPQLMHPSDAVRSCAIVGTRRATNAGMAFARDLARAAAREGLVVVSGLARGIDGAAHEGALEVAEASRAGAAGSLPAWARPRLRWAEPGEGLGPLFAAVRGRPAPRPEPGLTVAVLGGGHGHLYPAGHAGLARRILAAGGAVISEWLPDTEPHRGRFVQRNRVISGLSRTVVVVEAGARSGALHTVDHALEQGRTVLAVPAAPWSRSGAGCVRLLKEGAGVVADEADLLSHYRELVPITPPKEHEPSPEPVTQKAVPEERSEVDDGRRITRRTPAVQVPPLTADLAAATADAEGALDTQGSVQQLLLTLLGADEELSLDALLAELTEAAVRPEDVVRPAELMAMLARLELAGEVSATPAGRYRLRGR